LPDIFLTDLFKINVAIRSLYEITQINDSMEKSAELFPTSNQMLTNYALVAYLLHDTNAASEAFSKLRKKDPFQLEHMDIYSDILFVTGDRVTLSNLACECMKIEKYRFETCIVVGKFIIDPYCVYINLFR
jgi:anaphase-promoting complex subunit 8